MYEMCLCYMTLECFNFDLNVKPSEQFKLNMRMIHTSTL